MGKSISRTIRSRFYGFFLKRAPRHVLKAEIARRQIDAATRVYGAFLDADNFQNEVVRDTASESNKISGVVAHALRSVSKPADLLFLPGERRSARAQSSIPLPFLAVRRSILAIAARIRRRLSAPTASSANIQPSISARSAVAAKPSLATNAS